MMQKTKQKKQEKGIFMIKEAILKVYNIFDFLNINYIKNIYDQQEIESIKCKVKRNNKITEISLLFFSISFLDF